MNSGDLIELKDGKQGIFIEYNKWDNELFYAEINGKKESLCIYQLKNNTDY